MEVQAGLTGTACHCATGAGSGDSADSEGAVGAPELWWINFAIENARPVTAITKTSIAPLVSPRKAAMSGLLLLAQRFNVRAYGLLIHPHRSLMPDDSPGCGVAFMSVCRFVKNEFVHPWVQYRARHEEVPLSP